MAHTTKLYKNTGKQTLNVIGVGEIEPGQQLSVNSEYQPPVNVANYPGLVDVSAQEEQDAIAAEAAANDKAKAESTNKGEGSKK